MESTIEKVRKHLAQQLEVDLDMINPDTDVLDDLGADSLDLAELLLTLEEEFGIVITDDSAHQLRTVQEIADFVDHLIG